MELKIKVHSKPRIEFGAEGVNGHKSTKEEREYVIEDVIWTSLNVLLPIT